MPVQRAEDVLNKYMGEYLAARVPEDKICTYSVAQVTYEVQTCEEHGSVRTTAVVWQVHLFMESLDPESEDKAIQFNTIVPYDFFQDGDTECLETVLDPMWNDVVFSEMMGSVAEELEGSESKPEE